MGKKIKKMCNCKKRRLQGQSLKSMQTLPKPAQEEKKEEKDETGKTR